VFYDSTHHAMMLRKTHHRRVVSRSVKFDRTGSEHGFRARAVAEAPGAAGCRDTLPRVSAASANSQGIARSTVAGHYAVTSNSTALEPWPGPPWHPRPRGPERIARAARPYAKCFCDAETRPKTTRPPGTCGQLTMGSAGGRARRSNTSSRFVRSSGSSKFRGTGTGLTCLRPARCRCPSLLLRIGDSRRRSVGDPARTGMPPGKVRILTWSTKRLP